MQVHLPWHGECEPFTTVRWFGSCPQTGQKAKRKVSAGFLLQASCLVFQRLLYIWVCTYGCVLISIFFFREPVILGDSPYCLIFSQLLLSRPHIWVQTHSDFTLQNEDLNSCNGGTVEPLYQAFLSVNASNTDCCPPLQIILIMFKYILKQSPSIKNLKPDCFM